ncbi:hypothetical protein GCM10016272_21520 [Psychrobacter glaciei]|uniref:DUF4868 domain-containing protein n=2 Tax=Psychrobacter glaciei TaxID=619771 RepID=A0ABQ3GV40_9GAMM|nr:hypothetical protein GCM10016272_21520 [Psychrobacter glaciei]
MSSDDDMPSVNFTVKYDGEAIREHEMDVALLAPALLGMQKIIEELVKASTEGEYKASLKIKGNVKQGSIEIELVTQAIANFPTQIIDFFSGKYTTAAANLITIIGAGGLFALYNLVRKYGHKRPEKIEYLDGDKVKLYFDNETTIVNQNVFIVYNKFEVRENLFKTVKPLEKEGIDTFEILKNGELLIQVKKDEVSRFFPPRLTESLLLDENITYLQIKSISFNLNNKWTFTNGDEDIKANIIDSIFIDKVAKRDISFSDGDILKVRLEKEQYMENDKLKTSYKIIEVLEHIKGSQQIPIDFPNV